MRTRIEPMMLPAARALVRRHLDAGDLCAIITSTNSFVTRPISAAFGIEHLIATEPEQRNGRFTGGSPGCPRSATARCAGLDEWLAGLGRRFADFGESACYSDSHNDLPLLERVSRPVAVDPDETLAREACAPRLGENLPTIALR
jgi:HAD superfamily phosphoserine phosphatase-like hydrolase